MGVAFNITVILHAKRTTTVSRQHVRATFGNIIWFAGEDTLTILCNFGWFAALLAEFLQLLVIVLFGRK